MANNSHIKHKRRSCGLQYKSCHQVPFNIFNILFIETTLKLLSNLHHVHVQLIHVLPGPEGQSVVSLIVDPEAMSLILAWSHTFVEIDDEIFSTIILLLVPVTSKGMCMKYWLTP